MSVSKFKATCSSVLERVRRTGRPVLITKFGKPLAAVGPAQAEMVRVNAAGCMRGQGRILGDIVSPTSGS